MAFASSTTTTTYSYPRPSLPKTPPPSRSLRRPSATASTPNLKTAYATVKTPPVPPLPRKISLAALTSTSLANIPDVTGAYAYESVVNNRPSSRAQRNNKDMAPTTPGRPAGDDVSVGDAVDVPGSMHGVVRFIGSVRGKKGVFAGVELDQEFAARGKNNGDVDG